MLKVTVGNNIDRKTVIIDANTTLRKCLDDNGVDFSRGVLTLNGSSLRPGDIDKTFSDLGVTNTAFLMSITKADNA